MFKDYLRTIYMIDGDWRRVRDTMTLSDIFKFIIDKNPYYIQLYSIVLLECKFLLFGT
mgnify:CR=1 FL=1